MSIRIPQRRLTALRAMPGLITEEEGRALAECAASVLGEHAIVEVGAHRGLSSAWLCVGAQVGHGAPVFSIDPWPGGEQEDPRPEAPWHEPGALTRWRANVQAVEGYAVPEPTTARELAGRWAEPVGFWFHDADHAYAAVRDDYRAWRRFLVPGAWVAVHDYYGKEPDGTGGWRLDGSYQRAIADHMLSEGTWSDVKVIGNLWVGRRA